MRNFIFVCLLPFICNAAFAQFPGNLRDRVNAVAGKYKDLEITDQEEVQLGFNISERIRSKFGVVQDPEIHRYVTLAGMTLAQKSSRSRIPYQFIILDTDGVNAFAAPGGFVHITRGALALMKNEAELAGVLAHELIHITAKHAVRAIQKNKSIQMAADSQGLSSNTQMFRRVEDEIFNVVFSGFGRADELESDEKGVRLAASAGYDPSGLKVFLETLKERNAGTDAKQGLFASHPEMDERLEKITACVQKETRGGGAVNQDRLARHVKYASVPLAQIAAVEEGASGLTGGGSHAAEDKEKKKKEDQQEPKKKSRFSLSKLRNPLGGGAEKTQSAEVTGSGGSRGVDKEQLAKGGPNPARVSVTITDQELQSFKREGGLKE
jgi:predicted Zn-dependent protease